MALHIGPRYPTRPGALRRAADRSGVYLTLERQERRERADAARAAAATSVTNPLGREGGGLDRVARSEVREIRPRTTAGLRGSPPVVLSGWRGRSGRRYVVAVCAAADETDLRASAITSPIVALAVGRSAHGDTEILNASVLFGSGVTLPTHPDANELHVHRLAGSEAEAHAAVADLAPLAA